MGKFLKFSIGLFNYKFKFGSNPAQPAPGAFMLHGMQNGAKLMQNGGGQVHQQISQMIGKGAAPEMDEMAPQSISVSLDLSIMV